MLDVHYTRFAEFSTTERGIPGWIVENSLLGGGQSAVRRGLRSLQKRISLVRRQMRHGISRGFRYRCCGSTQVPATQQVTPMAKTLDPHPPNPVSLGQTSRDRDSKPADVASGNDGFREAAHPGFGLGVSRLRGHWPQSMPLARGAPSRRSRGGGRREIDPGEARRGEPPNTTDRVSPVVKAPVSGSPETGVLAFPHPPRWNA